MARQDRQGRPGQSAGSASRAKLFAAVGLLVGWFCVLGYLAATRVGRRPVPAWLVRDAELIVRGRLADGRIRVVEVLKAPTSQSSPPASLKLSSLQLSIAERFPTEGVYFLVPASSTGRWKVLPLTLEPVPQWAVFKDNPRVVKQIEHLLH